MIRRYSKKQVRQMLFIESNFKEETSLTLYLAFYGKRLRLFALNHLALFAIRAVLFCLGVVYLKDFTCQIFSGIGLQLAYIGAKVVWSHNLWAETGIRYLSCFNEVTIYVFLVLQILFSAFFENSEYRSHIGLGLIGLVNFTIVVSILFQAHGILRYFKLRCRRMMRKRRKVAVAHYYNEDDIYIYDQREVDANFSNNYSYGDMSDEKIKMYTERALLNGRGIYGLPLPHNAVPKELDLLSRIRQGID